MKEFFKKYVSFIEEMSNPRIWHEASQHALSFYPAHITPNWRQLDSVVHHYIIAMDKHYMMKAKRERNQNIYEET